MTAIRALQRTDQEAMQSLWMRAKCEETIPGVLLEKTFDALDYDPDLCVGYFENDDLAGFACGALLDYDHIAGIRVLLVDPARRQRGIGTSLLREMESRLQGKRKASKIRVMALAGNYFLPGIDPFDMDATCFAEKHGYRWFGYAQNLIADIGFERNYQERAKSLTAKGYGFYRAEAEYVALTFKFLHQHFPHWTHEVKRSLLNDPPTIHIAVWEGEVVAMACAESNNVGSGTLGPWGVHASHRGGGVGHVVLHRCVDDLQNLGFKQYLLGWTNPDVNRFFRREFGAKRHGIYWIYEKQIS